MLVGYHALLVLACCVVHCPELFPPHLTSHAPGSCSPCLQRGGPLHSLFSLPLSLFLSQPGLDLFMSTQSPVLASYLPRTQLILVSSSESPTSDTAPLPTPRLHVSLYSLTSFPLAVSHSTVLLFFPRPVYASRPFQMPVPQSLLLLLGK